jgi:micrococcal nuclease
MYCSNCGMEGEGNYCSNCGTSLKNSNVATMAPSPDQAPPIKPPASKNAIKTGCGCLLIAFGLLFVLALIGSLFFANSKDSTSTSATTDSAPAASTATMVKPTSGFITATVLKAIDGDTIDVSINEKTYRIRLIGVDCPDTKDPKKSISYIGKEASGYTTKSLSERIVYLEYDTQSKDKYGRMLAYVWLSKPNKIDDIEIRAKMFNADLLLNGYAQTMTVPPNVKYVDYFKDYQKEARIKEVGLWAKTPVTTTTAIKATATTAATTEKPASATTTTEKKQNPATTTTGKTSITSPSTSGDVTVYITRTGKKYHSYGCRYLRQSCIPIKLSDAIAQGYEPCSVCGPPTE